MNIQIFFMHNPKVQLKSLAIIEYLIILCILFIILLTPPSISYEISLYYIYPWYVWIGLAIPLIMPFLIVPVKKFHDHPKILLTIYFGAILSIFLLLSFPIIRNYPFYGAGDIHSHLGSTYNLIKTGSIGVGNPYPIIHILICSLSLLLGLIPEKISLFFPQLFIFVYILSLYLLAKSLELDTNTSLIIASLGFLPIFGSFITVEYIFPSMDAFLLFPFFMYIFIKSRTGMNSLSFKILIVPILLLIPFFHPELLLFYCAFIILYILIMSSYKKYNNYFQNFKIKTELNTSWIPILCLFLGFWIWSLSNIYLGSTIRELYNTLILNLSEEISPLESLTGGFQRGLSDVVQTLVLSYGSALIFLILGFLISIYIFYKINQNEKMSIWILLVCCSFFLFIFFNIIFLFKGTAIGFHIYRQIKYPLLISTLLIGFLYSVQIKRIPKKRYLCNAIIILLIISTIIGIFNFYPSPTTQRVNAQPTHNSIAGMNFLFNVRDPGLLIMEAGNGAFQNRYADYLLINDRQNIRWGYLSNVAPIPHFGYNQTNTLGSFYDKSQYLLLYPPSRELYPLIYPKYEQFWRYSPDEHDLLNTDPSLLFFYNNCEFKILKIN